MCKASGVNFSMLCTANIDIAMVDLSRSVKIKTGGSFKDGSYFKLDEVDRTLVDKMVEEICLSTRFLSLLSNVVQAARKSL